MLVQGLNGKTYKWNLKSQPRNNASTLHIQAKELLHTLFPLDIILEEVLIPGSHLFIDLYIHRERLAIEVQGQQHYKFNQLFHNNVVEFNRSKMRDSQKRYFCELNNIILVELPYNECNQWRRKVESRGKLESS